MKRIIHPVLFAALALSASAVSLLAQEPSPHPQGPPPHHGPPPPSELFKALDTNHDGVISADEIANAPAALKALAGASGQITRESLRPKPPGGDDSGGPAAQSRGPGGGPEGRHHGPPPQDKDEKNQPQDQAVGSPGPGGPHHGPPHAGPLFDALDANHDGVISADEIANAPAALKTLDKNGDGQLTREELRPAGPPPGHSN